MIKGRGRGRPRQTLKTTTIPLPEILKDEEVTAEDVEKIISTIEAKQKVEAIKVEVKERKSYEKNTEIKIDLIRCPTCDSSDTLCFGTTAFPGRTMMLDGKMIEGIRIQRRKCENCTRHFVVKIPLY